MVFSPLSAEQQQFIRQHITADVPQLLLRPPRPAPSDLPRLAEQIRARQKARQKLPTWYDNDALVFPPAVSVEQASSEETATYKASLVAGAELLDVTGGMGVDAWAFSQRMARVHYVERSAALTELAAHNLPLLGAENRSADGPASAYRPCGAVQFHTADALDFLRERSGVGPVDWLYLDPHRRDGRGGRVVQLADCEPNVAQPETLRLLLGAARNILLKTSPLLDLEDALRQLNNVAAAHVVAVQGEVKEILFVLGQSPTSPDDVLMTAVNLTTTGPGRWPAGAVRPNAARPQTLTFRRGDERSAAVTLADPATFLYESNAAVLKAGAFKTVANAFGLGKLAPHSHLYTADRYVDTFPGRAFRILNVLKPDARALRSALPDGRANLTVRNFPATVDELRRKLNVAEGGDAYIFATTLRNGDKRLLLTEKASALAGA